MRRSINYNELSINVSGLFLFFGRFSCFFIILELIFEVLFKKKTLRDIFRDFLRAYFHDFPWFLRFSRILTLFTVFKILYDYSISPNSASLTYNSNIGVSDSKQSHQIYEHAESMHVFANGILTKISIASVTGLITLPALFPISYAIFNYPPPDLWTLSLETQ